MKEVVAVKLENEMDIILAHKRAMKIGELCGCSLVTQTTLATAVSEIARIAVECGKGAVLDIGLEASLGKKFIVATVKCSGNFIVKGKDALMYAKRLIDDVRVVSQPKDVSVISIRYAIGFGGTMTDQKINSFKEYFEREPPLSPYDELRRKNQMLQDLAEKIRDSESEYKMLSDNLPLMMFSANNRNQITFTNRWLQEFMFAVPKELSGVSWQPCIHEAEYPAFTKELSSAVSRQVPFSGQYRLRQKSTDNYFWHMFSLIPVKSEKEIVSGWIGFLVDIHAQKRVDQTLKDNRELKDTQNELFRYQDELERKVIELNRSNYELEQFAHLASHDLQEPLRKLFFYSDLLKKKYSTSIDASGVTMLNNMTHAAARMRELIQDLLSYSQLHKQKLAMEDVSLQSVMDEIIRDLDMHIRDKDAVITISQLPLVKGNRLRLRQLFTNLISNSLKYSRVGVRPVIDVNAVQEGKEWVMTVKDNGIGFDQQYSEKIFGLFERLHSRDEFPGTGIGLSICKKIAELHGGTISAKSKQNEYSVFEVRFPTADVELAPVSNDNGHGL
jgi:PAS domain S-box-containing protein